MLVVMRHDATAAEIDAVVRTINELGYEARPIPGKMRTAIGLIGNDGKVNADRIEALNGVLEIIHVSQQYKQVSREWREEPTIVTLDNGTRIGAGEVSVMAGPCSVESEEQIIGIAHRLRDAGATILRGGAFKPRTSPYSFQGMGEDGLKLLARAREETGMSIVTEAVDPESLDLVVEYADIVQIGARNMQNFSLLRRAGRAGKPVLLKRGMAATVKDLLLSAEYLLAEGNGNVILCERGVRGFDTHTRNLLDLTAIPVVKSLSHLPIIADPSHGTGLRAKVIPMARAAVAAGADGLMIEVHPDPEHAMSDGAQSLYPDQFEELMSQIAVIAEAIGQRMVAPLPAVEGAAAAG
ncbi:3-deoxy-7-phosphoheptulonate synthase [Longimicrobium terrae]|nr:3-deoxy-7-phosphoheptulonate synthase [Longimicrobium terrae]NNC30695.1 3-deoxy-7-phosphoheptulonate synthase [Longimicrobium terrae]